MDNNHYRHAASPSQPDERHSPSKQDNRPKQDHCPVSDSPKGYTPANAAQSSKQSRVPDSVVPDSVKAQERRFENEGNNPGLNQPLPPIGGPPTAGQGSRFQGFSSQQPEQQKRHEKSEESQSHTAHKNKK